MKDVPSVVWLRSRPQIYVNNFPITRNLYLNTLLFADDQVIVRL
jgi:hypothetical protein